MKRQSGGMRMFDSCIGEDGLIGPCGRGDGGDGPPRRNDLHEPLAAGGAATFAMLAQQARREREDGAPATASLARTTTPAPAPEGGFLSKKTARQLEEDAQRRQLESMRNLDTASTGDTSIKDVRPSRTESLLGIGYSDQELASMGIKPGMSDDVKRAILIEARRKRMQDAEEHPLSFLIHYPKWMLGTMPTLYQLLRDQGTPSREEIRDALGRDGLDEEALQARINEIKRLQRAAMPEGAWRSLRAESSKQPGIAERMALQAAEEAAAKDPQRGLEQDSGFLPNCMSLGTCGHDTSDRSPPTREWRSHSPAESRPRYNPSPPRRRYPRGYTPEKVDMVAERSGRAQLVQDAEGRYYSSEKELIRAEEDKSRQSSLFTSPLRPGGDSLSAGWRETKRATTPQKASEEMKRGEDRLRLEKNQRRVTREMQLLPNAHVLTIGQLRALFALSIDRPEAVELHEMNINDKLYYYIDRYKKSTLDLSEDNPLYDLLLEGRTIYSGPGEQTIFPKTS